MNKIRKGDEVIVLVGKDKGKRGIVQQRISVDYITVSNVNVVKKAVKSNPMIGVVGGIVDKLMPVHVSNVALFDVKTGRAGRVGFMSVDGGKARVFKSSNEVIKV